MKKCGDCKLWDRKNIKKMSTQEGVNYDDIAICLYEDGEGWFEYGKREIECGCFEPVEPEVYTVECRINGIDGFENYMGFKSGSISVEVLSGYSPKLKEKLKGKRVKATFEVLD
jgi:hypothetical protein